MNPAAMPRALLHALQALVACIASMVHASTLAGKAAGEATWLACHGWALDSYPQDGEAREELWGGMRGSPTTLGTPVVPNEHQLQGQQAG